MPFLRVRSADISVARGRSDGRLVHTYEHSLDRVACVLGGQAVHPPAFSFIPAMLASHDWRLRHAGLMAIAAIAEGTSKVMQQELGKVIEYVPRSLVYSALPHSFPSREDWSSRCSTTHIHACDMRHASACLSPRPVLPRR